MTNVIVINTPEGELPYTFARKIRAMFLLPDAPRFLCANCNMQCDVEMGHGAEPDEISCYTHGARWYGHVIPSHLQPTARKRRLRDAIVTRSIPRSVARDDLYSLDE